MKTTKRFFRKYFLSTVLIFLLFLLVNVVLVKTIFFVVNIQTTRPDLHIRELADMVSFRNGEIHASEEITSILHEEDAWAMILNGSGTVIWEENLPPELPLSFDAIQIAKFSKWYLMDYPLLMWEHPAGLFVVGYPPNSLVKKNLILGKNYTSIGLVGTSLVFAANILLMLLLFWRNIHRVEKAVSPILTGIETMSEGKGIHLSEQGDLAEISAGLNKASDQLTKKDSARAEWINGISHDIRTPLSIILGYAGELEEDNRLPIDARIQAGIICKQGERMRKLVANLNLASKLEYSMQPLNKTLMSPVELARQVMSDFLNNGLGEEFDMAFQTSKGAEEFIIEGDSDLLARMLENLIHNSIIHNPSGCNIRIRVTEHMNNIIISIEDTGSGISKSLLKSINSEEVQSFAWNFSGESTHGLGLNLVRQIVKVHQGKIYFENINPHGLKIVIKLPIKDRI